MSAFVPVWEIAQVGRQLADTLGAARRVYAVHAEPVPVTDGPGVPATSSGMAGIALEMTRVSFAYPGRRRRALTDVSFSVPAGSTVALVGPSGAGKTTVANLLLRFWDPDAGVVRLGGHDLRELRARRPARGASRSSPRTPTSSTTRCAATSCSRGPGPARRSSAAAVEHAALDDFVAALPDGLDTVVGERGAQLSGGQRQRVAIARAFLKDAPILILDEATSHLDAVSEQAVRGALDVLLARPHDGRHRPSAVDGARRRPDHRARRGPSRRDGHPRDPSRPRRPLPAPRLPPARRRARRPRLTPARGRGRRR